MGDLEPWKSVFCRMRAMPGTAEPEVDRDITHLVHACGLPAPRTKPPFTAMNLRAVRTLTPVTVKLLRDEPKAANEKTSIGRPRAGRCSPSAAHRWSYLRWEDVP